VRVYTALEGVKVNDVSKLAKFIRSQRLDTFRNLRRNYKFSMDKVKKIIDDRAKDAAIAKEGEERDMRRELELMSLQVVVLRNEVARLQGVIRTIEKGNNENGEDGSVQNTTHSSNRGKWRAICIGGYILKHFY
jgi:hypothetical protein